MDTRVSGRHRRYRNHPDYCGFTVVFGGKRIPELAKGLGKGIREFKDATSGKSDEPKELPKKD
ncbi:MAG: twin-arginine translocase TatA/TatE family subunit [Bacteroidetes bacterium]|nr:twin-arginine translocase TatA/TatE family subunit [Bacteroidota bacterium]